VAVSPSALRNAVSSSLVAAQNILVAATGPNVRLSPRALNVPEYRLHPAKPDAWSVPVSNRSVGRFVESAGIVCVPSETSTQSPAPMATGALDSSFGGSPDGCWPQASNVIATATS